MLILDNDSLRGSLVRVLDQTISSLKKSKTEFQRNPAFLEMALQAYWLMEFPVFEGRQAAERFFAPYLSQKLGCGTQERLFDSFLSPVCRRLHVDEVLVRLERALHFLENSSYYVS